MSSNETRIALRQRAEALQTLGMVCGAALEGHPRAQHGRARKPDVIPQVAAWVFAAPSSHSASAEWHSGQLQNGCRYKPSFQLRKLHLA